MREIAEQAARTAQGDARRSCANDLMRVKLFSRLSEKMRCIRINVSLFELKKILVGKCFNNMTIDWGGDAGMIVVR